MSLHRRRLATGARVQPEIRIHCWSTFSHVANNYVEVSWFCFILFIFPEHSHPSRNGLVGCGLPFVNVTWHAYNHITSKHFPNDLGLMNRLTAILFRVSHLEQVWYTNSSFFTVLFFVFAWLLFIMYPFL